MNKPEGFLKTTSNGQDGLSKTSKWAGLAGHVSKLYSYTRISKYQVRLLLIKPGSFDEQINASLLVVHDDQLGTDDFPYTALSYNWGGNDDDATIMIQDDPQSKPVKTMDNIFDVVKAAAQQKMLKVKPNLYEALRHLRSEKDVIAMWVDALCINQFDKDEKEEQVLKMADIYQRAYNVNVWLGHDSPGHAVSDRAMEFIGKVIDLENHAMLLTDHKYIEDWASLFELLKCSWFSRRWVIQELALAQAATVHCGKHVRLWDEFRTAISIFDEHFQLVKPWLLSYYGSPQRKQSLWDDDSVFEIDHLGAKQLVDMTPTLFRKRSDGSLESTKGLESLVCCLSGFDTSDPRDTINAFISISREANRLGSFNRSTPKPPAPDYGKDLFEIYRDFVKWVVETSGSLDIICRHWALKERTTPTPTTPRLVQLPSWIKFVEDSAWGKGEDRLRGRKAGDSFVGLPENNNYNASGRRGLSYKGANVEFPEIRILRNKPRKRAYMRKPASATPLVVHDMSLLVRGVIIGTVSFRTDPFPDGVITKTCLEGLGWSFDRHATEIAGSPDQLWQTLVADRDPQGKSTPAWYKRACEYCLTYQTNNGHINIGNILRQKNHPDIVHTYLRRVRAVTWNRSFIRGISLCDNGPEQCHKSQIVGFGPPDTKLEDIIAILYGCSVPVILRPMPTISDKPTEFQLVGEAYIYGKMDGEAFDDHCKETDFKLV
ncbi:heterokaryon incompatibility protein-domain-containing protein [Pyrenochaeta sp. MPI-SDFR-AT-0127]|nr:heterokaryon incompatibility protein-domain-containing protein [Pyrenochaeta sp. MPI-SDFR-AT-0127]